MIAPSTVLRQIDVPLGHDRTLRVSLIRGKHGDFLILAPGFSGDGRDFHRPSWADAPLTLPAGCSARTRGRPPSPRGDDARREPRTVPVADLLALVPHLLAGARALRERERWAHRIAFLQVTADEAHVDAAALEALARWIDPRPTEPKP
ncbi:MAG TPA: hypothetical protein VMN39_09275 [Longimicrobiaceae bacterium]|nr:hypothetical protein [Longimicrobiaceae bacterium]